MSSRFARQSGEQGGLRTAAMLEALCEKRRRSILRVLMGRDGAIGVRELAHDLALGTESVVDDPNRIVIDLHHNQLPRLDALGIVRYDQDARLVEPRESISELTPVLEFLDAKRRQ